ncbi:hypothetical protein VKT23_018989 [Stygiomarasmius scandens]|uniref:Uncharacterized protein n=1 Tax=Marasmiellus scandens TaxID=2682957 RepID=A0ABR1IS43_9AGAR
MSSVNTPQRMPRGGSCSNCRGGSQIEDLERQIEELESRIQEQERSIAAERTGNSVLLRNPYASYDASTTAQAQSVWGTS